MSAGQMIEVRGLTKRYGATLAVDGLSFTVRPGLVTGEWVSVPETGGEPSWRSIWQ